MLHACHAIGHSFSADVVFERQQIFVAVSAGDAKGWPAHQHARTRNISSIDRIA